MPESVGYIDQLLDQYSQYNTIYKFSNTTTTYWIVNTSMYPPRFVSPLHLGLQEPSELLPVCQPPHPIPLHSTSLQNTCVVHHKVDIHPGRVVQNLVDYFECRLVLLFLRPSARAPPRGALVPVSMFRECSRSHTQLRALGVQRSECRHYHFSRGRNQELATHGLPEPHEVQDPSQLDLGDEVGQLFQLRLIWPLGPAVRELPQYL